VPYKGFLLWAVIFVVRTMARPQQWRWAVGGGSRTSVCDRDHEVEARQSGDDGHHGGGDRT
jgi:hypothetical protein